MKVGERYTIKEDFAEIYLDENEHSSPGINDEMLEYAGDTYTIKTINDDYWIFFEEIPWTWDIRWLKKEADPVIIEEDDFVSLFQKG